MKVIIGRSAIIAIALLLGLIVFSAKPSIAETLLSQFQSAPEKLKQNPASVDGKSDSANTDPSTLGKIEEPEGFVVPPANYIATAYSLRGRTASGLMVARGVIAADPKVLPLGSRVRLEHPGYTGEYIVADTGGAVRGRRIDIWTPTTREALRFGRRTVKLTVLSYPTKRAKPVAKT
jgi:3D (Asp-Asp-Asp) domain-containing protein